MEFKTCCQSLLVLSMVVLSYGDDFNDNLTKVWSYTGAANPEGSRTAVVNVSSDSLLIQPNSYQPNGQPRSGQLPRVYSFKPRAIQVKAEQPQVERNVYYSQDKYKSEVLLPGSVFPIEEKVNRNLSEDEEFNPLSGGPFHPKAIPLMRGRGQKRSLDDDEIESPVQQASRRSLSYILGVEDEEEDDEGADGETEYEIDEEDPTGNENEKHYKHKGKPKKPKKLGKYMLPLLLAYKMKYFAMVPVMIGGLVLLVGATGLAGFFFALFAAVMGLQKGSY